MASYSFCRETGRSTRRTINSTAGAVYHRAVFVQVQRFSASRKRRAVTDRAYNTSNHSTEAEAVYRWLTGTHFKSGADPMYSARGRMRRLFEYCSKKWAVQPDMRLTAKNGVKRSIGIPIT